MAGGLSPLRDGLPAAQALVDLDRLSANYRAVAGFAGVPLMPVVKANAYGHGASRVARLLQDLGAPMLAVATLEEAVALRRSELRIPIVILAGLTHAGQARLCRELSLTPVVCTPASLQAVCADAGAPPLPVHVEVETGMNRLGFAREGLEQAAGRLLKSGSVAIEGMMTQLASADEDAEVTRRQLDRFDAALELMAHAGVRPRWIHAANSAGLSFLRPHHTLARPGLLLYGLRPRPLSPEVEVQPVMRVTAGVHMLKHVPAGEAVSYGGRWTAARASRVASVSIGYADGVPRTRAMSCGGEFAIRGRRAPVAGTVCMDLTMLDVTDLPEVEEADEAVLFGDDPTAWDVAERAGTNAWQVLTAVGTRLPRVYLRAGAVVAVESRA